MRTALLSITGAGLLMLTGATPSFASDVNCGIVMKSVKMGRSAQDIADTMMISTSDVEECKKKAAAEPPKPGAAPEKAPAKEPEPAAH
jgi:hypothetical protein